MPLSKEERARLERELESPFGFVELMCDGFKVVLAVKQWATLKFRVLTYVNGTFEGAWMREDCADPEVRFLRKDSKPMVTAARRREAEKRLGKRYVARDPYFSAIVTIHRPDWPSGKAALRHICKVCNEIQVLKPTPHVVGAATSVAEEHA